MIFLKFIKIYYSVIDIVLRDKKKYYSAKKIITQKKNYYSVIDIVLRDKNDKRKEGTAVEGRGREGGREREEGGREEGREG